jgi:hypothetical protein
VAQLDVDGLGEAGEREGVLEKGKIGAVEEGRCAQPGVDTDGGGAAE